MLHPYLRALSLLLALTVAGCTPPPQRVTMQQEMAMGTFTLRAVSARAYSRAHQGVPWEVEVDFALTGGTRFDRADFAEQLSRGGKLRFRTSDGWNERGWLLSRGDDRRFFRLHSNPPLGSHGYTIQIANPYGRPAPYLLDLGI